MKINRRDKQVSFDRLEWCDTFEDDGRFFVRVRAGMTTKPVSQTHPDRINHGQDNFNAILVADSRHRARFIGARYWFGPDAKVTPCEIVPQEIDVFAKEASHE